MMCIGPFSFLVRRWPNGQSSAGPTNTVAPAVTGSGVVNQVLTCSPGNWVGNGTITYAYQWLRNGAVIAGATSATYMLANADDGAAVRCRVTATDLDGSTIAYSNIVNVVTATAIVADTSPVMGVRGHNQRIDGESGTDGAYSVPGGTITGTVVTYERDNGGWAAQVGTALAQAGWTLRKKVVVSASNAPNATFYSSAIVVAAAPTLTPQTFDEAADTWDLTPSVSGTLHWATSLTTESPAPDGLGGWSGTTLETGTVTIPASGAFNLVAALTAASGAGGDTRKMTVYLEAATASSDALATNFTINATAAHVFEDNFNRADEALAASPNWTSTDPGAINIVSNRVQLDNDASVRSALCSAALNNDQYAQIEIADLGTGASERSVGCRVRASGDWATQGYYFQLNLANGSLQLKDRWNALATGTVTVSAGDVFKIEAQGTTIRVLKNGLEVLTTTNAQWSGGSSGLYGYTESTCALDNFATGNL